MNSNLGKQKFFIIYQITNLINNKIYVGAHITNNVNDEYMGSSKYLRKDIKELGRQNFIKIPLHVFDNKEDMQKMEAEIVTKEFCQRENTYNRMIGGITEFSWIGTIVAKDKYGNNMRVYKDDPRYLSGELVGVTKGNSRKLNPAWINKKHNQKSKNAIGKINSIHQQGINNSCYGTCWITKENKNKKIKKENLDDWLIQGWIKGRFTSDEIKIKQSIKQKLVDRKEINNPSYGTKFILKDGKYKRMKI